MIFNINLMELTITSNTLNYKYFKGMGDVEREQDGEGRGMSRREGGRMLKERGVLKVRGMLREEG